MLHRSQRQPYLCRGAELKGEKIDIVKYSEDDAEFITQALSPATVLGVEILPGDERVCRVTVPDNQLSLAIGNKGQNAKLAAKLTGYKIDIRPESGVPDTQKAAKEPAPRKIPRKRNPPPRNNRPSLRRKEPAHASQTCPAADVRRLRRNEA